MSTNHYTNLNNKYHEKVAPLLDGYAKFYWAGHDMWEEFHAFIINESKGSLKLYNGPSFSNSYTKPQFETAAANLSGVTFNTQQIGFKVGVYAITRQEYKKLLYILHPYEINDLVFGFDAKWRYTVKLSNIGDSTFDVIGYDDNGEELLYTELNLTFDVQGAAVAQSIDAMDFELIQDPEPLIPSGENTMGEYQWYIKPDSKIRSDLDAPFILDFTINATRGITEPCTITLEAIYRDNQPQTLFSFTVKNLIHGEFEFRYDSATGNLFLRNGDKYEVLSLLTTLFNGQRIVSALETTRFAIPGVFNASFKADYENLIFKLQGNYVYAGVVYDTEKGEYIQQQDLGMLAFARTNLI